MPVCLLAAAPLEARAAELILNECNAVSATNHLNGGTAGADDAAHDPRRGERARVRPRGRGTRLRPGAGLRPAAGRRERARDVQARGRPERDRRALLESDDDGKTSTFGAPNAWNGGATVQSAPPAPFTAQPDHFCFFD